MIVETLSPASNIQGSGKRRIQITYAVVDDVRLRSTVVTQEWKRARWIIQATRNISASVRCPT